MINKNRTFPNRHLTISGDLRRGGVGLALGRVLEDGSGEALMGEADVEEDDPGGGVGDEDPLHGEPHEELLLGQPLDAAERAEAEVAAHGAVEVGEVDAVVLGVAGLRELHVEEPRIGVEGEGRDPLG